MLNVDDIGKFFEPGSPPVGSADILIGSLDILTAHSAGSECLKLQSYSQNIYMEGFKSDLIFISSVHKKLIRLKFF